MASGSARLDPANPAHAAEIKRCCAAAYQSDWARLLLGDAFHPGGARLTRRLGQLVGLRPGMRVLDVASGTGASAILLTQTFGCEVLGVDYGAQSVRAAAAAAETAGLAALVHFVEGDAERLPVGNDSYDAIICECAYCTFPDKSAAAREFARVLRPGGRVGLSDLTRRAGTLREDLQGLLAWIACVADAQPVDVYLRDLGTAGLCVGLVERHDDALAELVRDIRMKLMGAELLLKLRKIEAPGLDLDQARRLARATAEAVRDSSFGYAMIVAEKPAYLPGGHSGQDHIMPSS